MKKTDIIFAFIFSLNFINFAFAQSVNTIILNDNWQFLKSDLGGIWETVRPVKDGYPEGLPFWENITLPHCYNASDAVDPDINYYQGPAWYKTQLEIKNPYKNGRTFFHFEGSGQKTEVYVYTSKVGSHVGGYDEWTVDITEAVNSFLNDKKATAPFNSKVPLSIRCDNTLDLEMLPSDLSDFNLYGGIYRYLNLVYVPSLSIEQLHIDSKVDAKGTAGNYEISLKLANKSAESKAILWLEIIDNQGKLINSSNQEITVFE